MVTELANFSAINPLLPAYAIRPSLRSRPSCCRLQCHGRQGQESHTLHYFDHVGSVATPFSSPEDIRVVLFSVIKQTQRETNPSPLSTLTAKSDSHIYTARCFDKHPKQCRLFFAGFCLDRFIAATAEGRGVNFISW
jgi:hypothetical protein